MIYTDYNILTTEFVQELAELVRAAIKEGWQPIGGPFILGDPLRPTHMVTFCQAMVKLPVLITEIVNSPTVGPYAVSHVE